MPDPPRPPPRLPRRSTSTFRPEFTLVLVYFFAFFVLFCLLLALPALLDAARSLPPGTGPLTDAESELASRVVRDALRGRLDWALIAAAVCVGIGTWTRALPGLRRR